MRINKLSLPQQSLRPGCWVATGLLYLGEGHSHVPTADATKYKAAAEAAASALKKTTEDLEAAQTSLGQQQIRAAELSVALSSAHAAAAASAAELDSSRVENARMAAELAALNAARAEMTAAWEKLTAAFAVPMPGLPANGSA